MGVELAQPLRASHAGPPADVSLGSGPKLTNGFAHNEMKGHSLNSDENLQGSAFGNLGANISDPGAQVAV